MTTQSSNQGLPYPDHNELVNDVPDYIKNLALALDKRIVGSYASTSALGAAGAFAEGSVVWLQDTNTLQVYDGTKWVSIYPSSPRIYDGSTAPASNLGAVGDFYIQW